MATFECPFCNEILEVKPPDRLHSAFSFVEPIPKSYHQKIAKRQYMCQNPECKKSITVFWYAPFEYFSRI
jgi:uncharacterized protein YlaI